MQKVFGLIALGLLVTSCSQSPMDELKSDTPTNHSNSVFWHKEMLQHSKLWDEAQAYCLVHGEKPNCTDVNTVRLDAMLLQGSTDVPAYGSSGHYLHDIKVPSHD